MAQHGEGGAQERRLAERVLGDHTHQALRRLRRAHPEERRLQSHHLLPVPRPLLLGALLPGTSPVLMLHPATWPRQPVHQLSQPWKLLFGVLLPGILCVLPDTLLPFLIAQNS